MGAASQTLSWWRSRWWWGAVLAAVPVVYAMTRLWVVPSHGYHYGILLLQVLVYPCLEETVFRGGLQARLLELGWARRQWCAISVANGLTSIGFALAHVWQHPPGWALAVLIPSLVMGWVYERWRVVTPCAVLHGWYNLAYFLVFT